MVVGNEHLQKLSDTMCYEILLKILLELSIDLNYSYNSQKTSVALEIYILSNLEILLEHLCRGCTPKKCLNFS